MIATVHRLALLGLAFFFHCGSGSSVIVGDGGGGTPPPASDWSLPSCTTVSGTDYLAFTLDEGQTVIDSGNHDLPTDSVFAFGLVPTEPNTLIASVNDDILRSVDAGCTWQFIATLPGSGIAKLSAVSDGSVYAFRYEATAFYHLEFDSDGNSLITTYQAPDWVMSLAVDPQDPNHLRIAAGINHQLFQSDDGGASFNQIGILPHLGVISYVTVFDPINLDHVVRGTSRLEVGSPADGLWVTFDGGTSWQQATGFGNARINAFQAALAGADNNIVWVLGLDVDSENIDRRRIYRSTDGGLSYQSVIASASDLLLNNGTQLFADPTDMNRLVFSITDPDNVIARQTHLYVYDFATHTLAIGNYPYGDRGELRALAFNPEHPENFFFGKTFQIVSKQGH